jgi:hypothetical protein
MRCAAENAVDVRADTSASPELTGLALEAGGVEERGHDAMKRQRVLDGEKVETMRCGREVKRSEASRPSPSQSAWCQWPARRVGGRTVRQGVGPADCRGLAAVDKVVVYPCQAETKRSDGET